MLITARKMGGSVGVVIPKALAAALGIGEGESLDVSPHQDGLVIRKSRRNRRPLRELVKEMDRAAYARLRHEFEGGPVGKEVL